LPFGLLGHPSLTFTVDQPEQFTVRLRADPSLARR